MALISPTCARNRVAADLALVKTAAVEGDAVPAVAVEGEALTGERGRARGIAASDHTRERVRYHPTVKMIRSRFHHILPVLTCKSVEFIVHCLFGAMGPASCRHRGARLGEHRPRMNVLLHPL